MLVVQGIRCAAGKVFKGGGGKGGGNKGKTPKRKENYAVECD